MAVGSIKNLWQWSKLPIKTAMLGILFFILILEVVFLFPGKIVNSTSALSDDLAKLADGSGEFSQIMKGVTVVGVREQQKDWVLWAEEGRSSKNNGNWQLDVLKARFFGNQGLYFDVKGKEGQVDWTSKNMAVKGSVVTDSSNGYKFLTEEVFYNAGTRSLEAPNRVRMEGPPEGGDGKLFLVGDRMAADLKTGSMKVSGNVSTEKDLARNKHIKILSDQAEFSGKRQQAHFLGNVKMEIEGMKVNGPEAYFQYDPKTQQVVGISVNGGARIQDDAKWADADNLQVDLLEEKFILNGSPRVVQNNDELRGEQIIFLNGGKKIQVRGGRAKVDEQSLEKVN